VSGTTWRAVLREAVELVGEVDARRLVEQASGHDGAELVLHLDEAPSQRSMAYFDSMLARRRTGEPLQYVVGRWGFRTLDLSVDRRVLIPRPETEEVAGAAIDEARRLGATCVVDLGTGAGGIALSMAVELGPSVDVWASDVSADALDVARANCAALGRAAMHVRLVEGSWYDALPDELRGAVDVIVSNPPYVGEHEQLHETVVDWEPHVALYGHPGAVVDGALAWLRRPGALVVEHAPWMGDELVARALAAGFDEAETRHDLTGRERYLVARLVSDR